MTLIVGDRYRARLEAPLTALGCDVFWLRDNPDVDPRLAGHVDLSIFTPDDRVYFISPSIASDIVNFLTNKNREVRLASSQGPVYPHDAGMCICRTGQYYILNEKTADPCAAANLRGTRIHVPQGYTKCSVCVAADNAIITADDTIASAAAYYNIDVCKIHPGHIVLDGFDYGFIGGATFLLTRDTLALTGTLDEHPDRGRILDFLDRHGVRPTYLTADPIFDIGGAMVLP